MVDWVTGGPEISKFSSSPSIFEAPRFYTGLDRPDITPTSLDVVVLRGFEYGDSQKAKVYGHDNWMRDLREFFERFSSRRKIAVEILDLPTLVKYGAMLVDKGTGKITLVEPSKPKNSSRMPKVITFQQSTTTEFSYPQLMQAMFISNLLIHNHQKICPPIEMQYDGKRHCLPVPLTDEARQLLRSVRQNEPPAAQRAIILSFGNSNDWVTQPRDQEETIQRALLKNMGKLKVCELCEKDGSAVCTACKGAWYCGKQHQAENWKAHKAWCKAHPYQK